MTESTAKIIVISVFGAVQILSLIGTYLFLEWEDRKKKRLTEKEEENTSILHSVIDE